MSLNRGLSSSGGMMIGNGCSGFGLLLYWLLVRFCLASCRVLREAGRSGRLIIRVKELKLAGR